MTCMSPGGNSLMNFRPKHLQLHRPGLNTLPSPALLPCFFQLTRWHHSLPGPDSRNWEFSSGSPSPHPVRAHVPVCHLWFRWWCPSSSTASVQTLITSCLQWWMAPLLLAGPLLPSAIYNKARTLCSVLYWVRWLAVRSCTEWMRCLQAIPELTTIMNIRTTWGLG